MEIVSYKPEFGPDFKRLNMAWLKKYFAVEPIDEIMLSDPEKNIIDKGGHIFFARMGEEIAGTFALLKLGENYELSKMAVDEKYQGKKIGNKLMESAISNARALGSSKLILFSNTRLEPAIHLYKKYGFKEIALEESEYQRSNIKMELVL